MVTIRQRPRAPSAVGPRLRHAGPMTQPMHPQPYQPLPRKPKPFGWVAAIIIGGSALLLGGCTGASAVSLARAPAPAPAVTVTAKASNEEVELAQRTIAVCANFAASADHLVKSQAKALDAARELAALIDADADSDIVDAQTERVQRLAADAATVAREGSYQEDLDNCSS